VSGAKPATRALAMADVVTWGRLDVLKARFSPAKDGSLLAAVAFPLTSSHRTDSQCASDNHVGHKEHPAK
jgi:hypothetical protein